MKPIHYLRCFQSADSFSPKAFVARAAIIVILYLISKFSGLENYTTFLSGASPNPNMSWQAGSALGLTHLLLYFAFVLLVPIFLITAGLLELWRRRNLKEE